MYIEIGSKILAKVNDEICQCNVWDWSPTNKYIRVGVKKGRCGWQAWIKITDVLEVL